MFDLLFCRYGNSTEQVTFVGLNVERIKGFLDNIASKSLEESDTKKTVFSPLRGVSKSNSLTTSGDLESEEQAAMTAICDFVKIAAQKAESFKEKRKDSNNSQSLLNV